MALDANTVTALREHRRRQPEERLAAGDIWNERADLVFTTDAVNGARTLHLIQVSDLVMLARLSLALAKARVVPLAA